MAKKTSIPAKASLTKTKVTAKKADKDVNDTAAVDAWIKALDHPMKTEIETVRAIIKGVSKVLNERIKWAAPSFFYLQDIVTFNHRMHDKVHLIFHHADIVKVKSPLLEGDYKDRRMTYFSSMAEIKKHKKELERIMQELIAFQDK